MNWKFASAILPLICWFGSNLAAGVQTGNPVTFTTAPKIVRAKLILPEGGNLILFGSAALTITQANENDSVTGTLVYTLTDDDRQKIVQRTSRALNEIPVNIIQKDLIANFQRGTACPVLRIQVAVREGDLVGVKLKFDSMILNIYETPDQLNQLFCSWTRQINAKRQRLGIIAAINRLIAVEKDEVENRTANP